jgi:hypothetical protein
MQQRTAWPFDWKGKVTMSQSLRGNRTRLGRKAVVEIQFNWIFILIAGALILFLFSSIILKQKTTADSTAQTTLLKDVTSIAIGSESTTGITKELALSKASITFGCNTLRIGQKSQPLSQMVIFSPSTVQTPLIVHTREWSLPFRATNVVYLSSPRIRYILIGDNTLARQVNKSMPEKFLIDVYKDYAAFSLAQLQEDDQLRIIVFGSALEVQVKNAPSLTSIPPRQLSLLGIPDSGTPNYGTMSFYQKTQTGWTTPITKEYLKEELLIGAIFTDNSEQFQCIKDNMLKKLRLVADIHDKRRFMLAKDTEGISHPLHRCNEAYLNGADADANFQTLKASSSVSQLFDAAYAPSNVLPPLRPGLSTINKNLERLSCPLLY